MAEARRRWLWRSWLPDVGAAFSRLPLAVLLAGFLTLFKLWADNPSEAELKILGTFAASFLWVIAVDLFVESQGRSKRTRVMAWIAGITAIALLFRFQWQVWFVVPLLFAALILAVGLSGHLGRSERNASFWQWRSWVWLALMPVLLLFLAAYARISAYGLTEQRYLIVLIGVWAFVLAFLRIWRPERFDLRLIPGVLAILLLVASFGPWGAMGASVLSQTAELAGILSDRGLLADGKIVAQPAGSEGASVLGTDAPRVRGIEWYLNTHHALSRLVPWFEGQEQNPFAEGKTPERGSRARFWRRSRSGPTFRNRLASSISPTTPTCLRSYRSAAAAT
jgi:hypothetical protein